MYPGVRLHQSWFLVLALDLWLKVRDVKIELKVLVDYLFCGLIVTLTCHLEWQYKKYLVGIWFLESRDLSRGFKVYFQYYR